MARVCFTTMGSWGDLFPMMPIAIGLRERGHEVVVAATPAAADILEDEGLEHAPVGEHLGFDEYAEHPEILDSRLWGLIGLRNLLRLFVFPTLAQTAHDLREACSGADLLVTHPVQLAGRMAAESARIPWATVSVFPSLLPSRWSVPQMFPLPALPTPAGRAVNAAAWNVSRAVARRLWDEPINEARAMIGLPAVRDAFLTSGMSPHLYLLLTSARYTPRLPDWPSHVKLTGFTPWDRSTSWQQDPRLEEFLSTGDAPILFTLGASLSIDPQGFFDVAAQALDIAGRRGLFLVGRDANVGGALAGRPGVWAFVPLSRVLPKVPAVVHHGGFGTTTACLLHGTPSVIVPRAFDQFHHARRVRALGVGTGLSWSRLQPARLAAKLRDLLDRPSYRERAEVVAKQLAHEDGPARACDEIEALLPRL